MNDWKILASLVRTSFFESDDIRQEYNIDES